MHRLFPSVSKSLREDLHDWLYGCLSSYFSSLLFYVTFLLAGFSSSKAPDSSSTSPVPHSKSQISQSTCPTLLNDLSLYDCFSVFFVHVWLRAVRCEVMSDRRQLQRSARKAEKYEGTAPAWSVRRHAVARASKYISSAIKRHVHRTHKLSRGARAADVVHPRYRTGVIPSVSFY